MDEKKQGVRVRERSGGGEGTRKDKAESGKEGHISKENVLSASWATLWTAGPGTSLAQPCSCWPLAPSLSDTPAWQGPAVLGSPAAQPLSTAGHM